MRRWQSLHVCTAATFYTTLWLLSGKLKIARALTFPCHDIHLPAVRGHVTEFLTFLIWPHYMYFLLQLAIMTLDIENVSPEFSHINASEKLGPISSSGLSHLNDQHGHIEGLQQKLNTRHLTFIGLGSVVGTGIFLGTGTGLTTTGPVGLVLAYVVICSVVYCVMLCTGEMDAYLPVVGAHTRLSGRSVDISLSAARPWNYWYCWSLISAAEAAAVIYSRALKLCFVNRTFLFI